MGKRARRTQRAFDMRKQPNERKELFVQRKVRELNAMDREIEECLSRTSPSTSE